MNTRRPAVAGLFYPDEPTELRSQIESLMALARPDPELGTLPKALIAPHAGYIYSGPVAASAYQSVRNGRDRIHRIVLLGPAHRVAFDGIAAPSSEAFSTPLGDVPVDTDAIRLIATLPGVSIRDDVHHEEHSLEVHLPFLQLVFENFSLVPLVVGNADAEQVAAVLEKLWGGPETLIIVSSDLSHYLDYESARNRDAHTCKMIESLSFSELDCHDACGRNPLSGLLLAARRHGLEAHTLDVRNSGDTAGTRSRVVGYGAWALTGNDHTGA